jgi:LmbE family N-acetylglucosaminyl deacetylase
VKAIAAVAHPDDCVIFAWPFIEAHPEFDWTIVYLTYYCTDPRGKEVREYWDKRRIKTHFLGFLDDYTDQQTQKLNFWYGMDAEVSLRLACWGADLILTHNEDGDYGHIHHKFVNNAVNGLVNIPKVYFASTFNYNTKCVVNTPVDTTELPLHKEVVEGFQDRNIGLYIVPEEAEKLLTNNK